MLTEEARPSTALEALDDDPQLEAQLIRKALSRRFEGDATYRQGEYIEGAAMARNLGHGDVVLYLSRCLAAGDPISLELDCLTYRSLPIQMKGRVIECRRDATGPGFVALVHVQRGSR